MSVEEQEALLEMWKDFLGGQRPSAALMRAFYVDVVSHSPLYRYGMAPELFDLLVNGIFQLKHSALWTRAYRDADGHRAA